jgi:dipeptidase E
MARQTIVGIGGFPDAAIVDYVLGFARGRRVLVDGTATPGYEGSPLDLPGELTYFSFWPWPPEDLRELALSHDAILVCGGNTANMLAVWRVHGFDRILREAWEAGVVLFGWSARMICWFEAGVTDSFGPQLAGLRDGLGFLPGSACPHYDGEEERRPVYRRLVAGGFPAGLALDDAAAARFEGRELVEIVATAEAARGYRVGPEGEATVEARRLAAPGPELGDPGERPQPDPDRGQQDVEEEVPDQQGEPPEPPAPERDARLRPHRAA